MAIKYKPGGVRRRRKANLIGKIFRVAAALIERGEQFAYLELGPTGKVKVIK